MPTNKILNDWKQKNFKPIYWLEGEESYYIDKLVNFAESNILSEAEASFNLSVLYGRDIDAPTLISNCKKYPMFGDLQVVILKEAQHMRDLEKIEDYFTHPQPSTVLVIAYKDKKLDARTKFAKTVKANSEFLSTKKVYESDLPKWISGMVQGLKFSMNENAIMLLADHIGNDLARLENEIKKITVNLTNRKEITVDDIELYVGVSKEFNTFELQKAIVYKDLSKALRIIQYFASNPKAGPIQMILPNLYNFFSKLAIAHSLPTKDERNIATALGINYFFVKDYTMALRNYSYEKVEQNLLHLHEYNLRSIGINNISVDSAELLKELSIKLMYT